MGHPERDMGYSQEIPIRPKVIHGTFVAKPIATFYIPSGYIHLWVCIRHVREILRESVLGSVGNLIIKFKKFIFSFHLFNCPLECPNHHQRHYLKLNTCLNHLWFCYLILPLDLHLDLFVNATEFVHLISVKDQEA